MKVQKSPKKYIKDLVITSQTEVWHVCDIESEDETHRKGFESTLKEMAGATKLGKQISYKLGYSNYTFELWILLHMTDLRASQAHRKQYVSHINKVFNEKFDAISEFKKEANFKRCLSKLTIENVIQAITRAEEIEETNKGKYRQEKYCNYSYYTKNPSLSLHLIIKKILIDCGLLSR